MSDDLLDVPEGEGGILRLFRLDTDTPDGAKLLTALTSQDEDASKPAAAALGADDVDPWWVTVVRTAEIADLGLQTFLSQGYDVSSDQLSEAAETLRNAEGTLILVQSPAFRGRAETIRPASYLEPLTALDTKRRPAPAEPMAQAKVASVDRVPPAAGQAEGKGSRALRPAILLGILLVAALLVALAAFGGA